MQSHERTFLADRERALLSVPLALLAPALGNSAGYRGSVRAAATQEDGGDLVERVHRPEVDGYQLQLDD